MIRELGPMSVARLFGVARTADRDRRGVALLAGEGWSGVELGVDPVEEHRIEHGLDALPQVATLLDRLSRFEDARGWNGRKPSSRYIGYVAYEAARAIERERHRSADHRPPPTGASLVLRRYAATARRDPATGIVSVEGDDPRAVDRLATLLRDGHELPARPLSLELEPVDSDAAHEARIRRVLELIARGDLYQANVARTFARTIPRETAATSLLDAMLARTGARFATALDFGDHALASSSPELFLDVSPDRGGRRILTTPIKGTRPRGVDAESDAAAREELANDAKERAELVMIVDLERNDLGRVATIGSVRVPGPARIESSRTVHHRVHDVIARVPSGVGLGAIVRATFPSGSVTGAPKVRAMEVVAELERDRRGVYCGALLSIDRAGGARAAMAIRTVVLDRRSGVAVYAAGGGIVEGSRPEHEVEETRWKARQVMAR